MHNFLISSPFQLCLLSSHLPQPLSSSVFAALYMFLHISCKNVPRFASFFIYFFIYLRFLLRPVQFFEAGSVYTLILVAWYGTFPPLLFLVLTHPPLQDELIYICPCDFPELITFLKNSFLHSGFFLFIFCLTTKFTCNPEKHSGGRSIQRSY